MVTPFTSRVLAVIFIGASLIHLRSATFCPCKLSSLSSACLRPQRKETLVLSRLPPRCSSFSMRPTLSAFGLKSSRLLLRITSRDTNFHVTCGS